MILRKLFGLFFTVCAVAGARTQETTQLPPWQPGYLDFHYISTGGGNCAFGVLPDGTTMMVDAGELDPTLPRTLSPRNTPRYPDWTKMCYEWQIDYIRSMFPAGHDPVIDYAIVTHYHDDHFGGYYSGAPQSTHGHYCLSGITGVGDAIPIRMLIDRGDDYPFDLRQAAKSHPAWAKTMENYWQFIDDQGRENGMVRETLDVGSKDQIVLKHDAAAYPEFSVRGINVNGVVWGGEGSTEDTCLLPDTIEVDRTGVMPRENLLSTGILLSYGPFRYYTAGDLLGTEPAYRGYRYWDDMESVVAPIVGRVDVTTANHHGNRSSMTAYYLSVLRPRVIIQEVWSSDHPGHETLLRMTSKHLWPDERDLFATNMLEANKIVIGPALTRAYKATEGHIVLRVMPGGEEYYVYSLNHRNTTREVTGKFGPYRAVRAQAAQ